MDLGVGDFCVDDPCYIFVYPKAEVEGIPRLCGACRQYKEYTQVLKSFLQENVATLREKECGLVGKNFSVDER